MEALAVGDKFSSYEELMNGIEKYQQATCTQFWKRDARSVGNAAKRLTRKLKPELKYYEVRFCCIFGGKKFQSKGTGRRQTGSFRKGCPAYVHLGASEDGQSLTIRSLCEEHNHEVNEELFRKLPQRRKLTPEEELEAAQLLQFQANKKHVQHYMSNKTGKVVLLKDLSNIRSICEKRWREDVLEQASGVLPDNEMIIDFPQPLSDIVVETASETVLSEEQKYKRAVDVAMNLASLAAEVGNEEFRARLTIMQELEKLWLSGQDAVVQAVVTGSACVKSDAESDTDSDHSGAWLDVNTCSLMEVPPAATTTTIGMHTLMQHIAIKPEPDSETTHFNNITEIKISPSIK